MTRVVHTVVWAHIGLSCDHLGPVLGLLAPFWNHLVAILGLCFSFALASFSRLLYLGFSFALVLGLSYPIE